jgi:tetratricopeptide (TPR) repeat protein
VLLSGEAGIGKSRLVKGVKERLAGEPHTMLECRCSPYHQNSALYPVIEPLGRVLQFQRDDSSREKLEKLETALSQYSLPLQETVPLLATLFSFSLPENLYPVLTLPPQRQKQRTLETIRTVILALAEQRPMLLIIEDLHWIDPSTLELLGLFVDQEVPAPLCTLCTCRPTFVAPWTTQAHITEIVLSRLLGAEVMLMVGSITGGKTLPAEVLQQIVSKTDGVPLFVEELTKTVLESGLLSERSGHYALAGPLPPLAIPTTLQDSLMARLDRLDTTKTVAQLGATLGRTFSYELLKAVASHAEATLQEALHTLIEAELLYAEGTPPQATYMFKHALIQDVAYQSLLRSTRQHYHQRVAQVLAAQFPETVETQPELLAHHYTEAGLNVQAIGYWQRAGERATQRSANAEAIHHLTRGLEVLGRLPDTPERTQQELELYIALGGPLQITKGWASPEVAHVYAHARELCLQIGDTPQLTAVLGGLAVFYQNRGELQTARELREQSLTMAQRQQDPTRLMAAYAGLVSLLYCQGEYTLAHTHFEQCRALYDTQRHRSWTSGVLPSYIHCLSVIANVLQLLGYPRRGLTRLHEALTLARDLAHPFTLAYVHFQAAYFHIRGREEQASQRHAEALLTLASEHEFAQRLAHGMILWGWVLAAQGRGAEGIAQIRQGIAAGRATGARLGEPVYLAWLAEAHRIEGQVDEGLDVVAEALIFLDKTGNYSEASELYRLKGELLLLQAAGRVCSPSSTISMGARAERGRATQTSPLQAEAEACFRQALDIAGRQQARCLELRAAMSLSRLWQQQGKRAEARQLLAEVYGWFTEGLQTVDLQEAQVLLEELA